MTTPSGIISAQDINTELQKTATSIMTLNDTDVRTLAGVLGSGTTISYDNLRNKSNVPTYNSIMYLDHPGGMASPTYSAYGRQIDISDEYIAVNSQYYGAATYYGGQGAVFLYYADTGAFIRRIDRVNANSTYRYGWGNNVKISGDRVFIHAINETYVLKGRASNYGRVHCYNILTGALLFTINAPESEIVPGTLSDVWYWMSSFGGSNSLISEPEATESIALSENYILIGNPSAGNPSTLSADGEVGYAALFNNSTGALVRVFRNPSPYDYYNSSYGGYYTDNDRFGTTVSIDEPNNKVMISGLLDKAHVFNLTTGALISSHGYYNTNLRRANWLGNSDVISKTSGNGANWSDQITNSAGTVVKQFAHLNGTNQNSCAQIITSANGKYILYGSDLNSGGVPTPPTVWKTSDGTLLKTFTGDDYGSGLPNNYVYPQVTGTTLAISPSGNKVAYVILMTGTPYYWRVKVYK